MRITNFELLAATQRPICCVLTDGREAALVGVAAEWPADSLVAERVREEGLLLVRLFWDDIAVIARGGSARITAAGHEGNGETSVMVRLATAAELMEMHAAACRAAGEEPNLTWGKAHELTAHL